MVTANDVKILREKTGAGMLDCKKALEQTNGDIEKAVDFLREKGLAKAQSKQGRTAADGLARIFIEKDLALILEINSETDFVAKNEHFLELIEKVGAVLIKHPVSSVEEALEVKENGQTISEMLLALTAKIGEKITLRRLTYLKASANQTFGTYLHQGGKIAALTLVENATFEIAKDVAMQAAAMKPQYLNPESVPAEVLEREKTVLTQQALNEGTKPEFVERKIEGRIRKYFEEVCLTEQAFFKNPSEKVSQYLAHSQSKLIDYICFRVGEGIEKKCQSFADEVAEQLKK